MVFDPLKCNLSHHYYAQPLYEKGGAKEGENRIQSNIDRDQLQFNITTSRKFHTDCDPTLML